MAKSIIEGLEKYFLQCDMLKDGCLRVDFMGEKPVEYSKIGRAHV